MTRFVRPAIAAALVLGFALMLTPLAAKMATQQIVPAADRVHYADALLPLMLLAGFGLFLAVSLLQTRRTTAAADGASTPGASNHPVAPARRPTRESVGRRVTP